MDSKMIIVQKYLNDLLLVYWLGSYVDECGVSAKIWLIFDSLMELSKLLGSW